MALPHSITMPLPSIISPRVTQKMSNSCCLHRHKPRKQFLTLTLPLNLASLSISFTCNLLRVPSRVQALKSDGGKWKRRREASSDTDDDDDDDDDAPPRFNANDPYLMSPEERLEWRRNIRQVLGQYFDKITIKNKKKDDDNDDDDVDRPEIVWQDDNYIRPIKDIKTAEWEETVFKDISPLIILVHNRYKRPKENEKIRDELEKAVHIIWNCRLPSPRCVAIDAVVETELVAALQVSVFPEIIFTKAGKILFRDKAIRSAEEWSKVMAYFYYGAAKPSCLNSMTYSQENIPSFVSNNPVS
uniref:Thioredoxin-like fold domain-containing protein MRL7L, chloroplastic n=1 Tax=Cajanus cajan TaxID=3821 RepID=A0A151U833_CAJCA|nr:hypothetical protein KK1_008194 [Cajanus cajan]